MAISTPLTTNFPNSPLSSTPSVSISSSVRFRRPRISAAHSTAKKSPSATEIGTFSFSLYDVLGIQIGANTREVKLAYRKLARVLHPDVKSGDSSADEFMEVHSAYTTLVDPARRANYDQSLLQWSIQIPSPIRSVDGYNGRRWETDQCW